MMIKSNNSGATPSVPYVPSKYKHTGLHTAGRINFAVNPVILLIQVERSRKAAVY